MHHGQTHNQTQRSKQINQMMAALIYFSEPFPKPIHNSQLQQSLTKIQSAINHPQALNLIAQKIIQRYYQITKNTQQYKIEEFLLIQFIQTLSRLVSALVNQNQQYFVIIISGCVTHLKKCTPESKFKDVITSQLKLMRVCIEQLQKVKQFRLQQIFPQISAVLMHYVIHPNLINHQIFDRGIDMLGKIIKSVYQTNPQFRNQKHVSLNNKIKDQKNYQTSPTFAQQFLKRIQYCIRSLALKSPSLQLIYKDSIRRFIESIHLISLSQVKLLSPLVILGQIVDFNFEMDTLSSIQKKLIYSQITNQFLQILQSSSSMAEKTLILKRLQKMARCLYPTPQQCQQIIKKFKFSLYIIQNNRSLIVPHSLTHTSYLIELTKTHNFGNYPIRLNSLLQSFDFECQRLLLLKMPFVQSNLSNLTLLRNIIYNIPSDTLNNLIVFLIQQICLEEQQYLVDMSLTKFYQFLTRILIIYWIIRKPGFKLAKNIAFNLFQVLSQCQAIRILKPSFQQQQILIGYMIYICYFSYYSWTQPNSTCETTSQNAVNSHKQVAASPIKRLKFKVCLLQLVINNSFQQSYIIKSIAYYVLISLSAPNSIRQMLHNLQSTLINRNINNVQFIVSLINYCDLTSAECENLVQKFFYKKNSEKLFRILLPNLSIQTIRKCLLSATTERGQWVHIMLGNTQLLHQKSLTQSQISKQKYNNFHMNDGQNVTIANMLGVVILQLGSKWQSSLQNNSPFKEPAINLLIQLINLDSGMVFFKLRFISIIKQLLKLINNPQTRQKNQNILSQRICNKIYTVLSKVPEVNYKIYFKNLTQDQTEKQKIKNTLEQLLQTIKKRHKKYQLNYLTNSKDTQASQMYDKSDQIITKISNALRNQQKADTNQ